MTDSNVEFYGRRRSGKRSKTASVRRDHHDNERARPLAVVSTFLLHANEILSAQNSLLGTRQHLRSPQPLQDSRSLTH